MKWKIYSFKLILMECYFNGGWILCDYIGDCIYGGLFQRVMEDESIEYHFNGGGILSEYIDYFDGGRPSDLWWARVIVTSFQNMAHHFVRQWGQWTHPFKL